MKRWLQRPNEYVSSFCAGPLRFRQSITGVRCRGWRLCISADVIDIFTSQIPYFDLHRPSLDPSHSFVISYVGTAVL